jgi:membrane protease YdiL (CAAX protease family)
MPKPAWPLFLLYLPLVKLATAPLAGGSGLAARALLFYGGGVGLSLLLVHREQSWPRLRGLLQRPLQGIGLGVAAFLILAGGATLLSIVLETGRGPVALLLRPPAGLLDLRPLWSGLVEGALRPDAGWLAFSGGGALAEEWIFRCVLLWRWVVRNGDTEPAPGTALRTWRATAGKLLLVNLYFAALHWPQPLPALGVALLGGLTLGVVVLWRPNYWLIATLHLLFNWLQSGG